MAASESLLHLTRKEQRLHDELVHADAKIEALLARVHKEYAALNVQRSAVRRELERVSRAVAHANAVVDDAAFPLSMQPWEGDIQRALVASMVSPHATGGDTAPSLLSFSGVESSVATSAALGLPNPMSSVVIQFPKSDRQVTISETKLDQQLAHANYRGCGVTFAENGPSNHSAADISTESAVGGEQCWLWFGRPAGTVGSGPSISLAALPREGVINLAEVPYRSHPTKERGGGGWGGNEVEKRSPLVCDVMVMTTATGAASTQPDKQRVAASRLLVSRRAFERGDLLFRERSFIDILIDGPLHQLVKELRAARRGASMMDHTQPPTAPVANSEIAQRQLFASYERQHGVRGVGTEPFDGAGVTGTGLGHVSPPGRAFCGQLTTEMRCAYERLTTVEALTAIAAAAPGSPSTEWDIRMVMAVVAVLSHMSALARVDGLYDARGSTDAATRVVPSAASQWWSSWLGSDAFMAAGAREDGSSTAFFRQRLDFLCAPVASVPVPALTSRNKLAHFIAQACPPWLLDFDGDDDKALKAETAWHVFVARGGGPHSSGLGGRWRLADGPADPAPASGRAGGVPEPVVAPYDDNPMHQRVRSTPPVATTKPVETTARVDGTTVEVGVTPIRSLPRHCRFSVADITTLMVAIGCNALQDQQRFATGISGAFAKWQSTLVICDCHLATQRPGGQDAASTSFSTASLGIPGASQSSLCLTSCSSLMQHSCTPNAVMRTITTTTAADASDGATTSFEVRAVRPILPGEPITISYVPGAGVLPRHERQRRLLERYYFHCRCEACGPFHVGWGLTRSSALSRRVASDDAAPLTEGVSKGDVVLRRQASVVGVDWCRLARVVFVEDGVAVRAESYVPCSGDGELRSLSSVLGALRAGAAAVTDPTGVISSLTPSVFGATHPVSVYFSGKAEPTATAVSDTFIADHPGNADDADRQIDASAARIAQLIAAGGAAAYLQQLRLEASSRFRAPGTSTVEDVRQHWSAGEPIELRDIQGVRGIDNDDGTEDGPPVTGPAASPAALLAGLERMAVSLPRLTRSVSSGVGVNRLTAEGSLLTCHVAVHLLHYAVVLHATQCAATALGHARQVVVEHSSAVPVRHSAAAVFRACRVLTTYLASIVAASVGPASITDQWAASHQTGANRRDRRRSDRSGEATCANVATFAVSAGEFLTSIGNAHLLLRRDGATPRVQGDDTIRDGNVSGEGEVTEGGGVASLLRAGDVSTGLGSLQGIVEHAVLPVLESLVSCLDLLALVVLNSPATREQPERGVGFIRLVEEGWAVLARCHRFCSDGANPLPPNGQFAQLIRLLRHQRAVAAELPTEAVWCAAATTIPAVLC